MTSLPASAREDQPIGVDAVGLAGKVAVVTGAARGIGRASALRLARHGVTVAICDRRDDELSSVAKELSSRAQDRVLSRTVDVRDRAALEVFAAEVTDSFGGVDILVNNAGGTFHAAFVDTSDNGEAMLIAENFTSVTRLTRLVAPLMAVRGGGSIINMTSVEAHQAAPGFAVYAAMKAAVANLTRSLALELSGHGIRVNAIALDAIPTHGDSGAREQLLASGSRYEPVHLPPLGHWGTPDDAAAAVVFLASMQSRFMTGSTLHVDGGTWAAGGWRLADTQNPTP